MDASTHSRQPAGRILLGLVLLVLSGCVNTSLIDRWKDASFAGPPLHKVLVVGVQKDDGRRRLWEDGMVGGAGSPGRAGNGLLCGISEQGTQRG